LTFAMLVVRLGVVRSSRVVVAAWACAGIAIAMHMATPRAQQRRRGFMSFSSVKMVSVKATQFP
jgi:hypothetical protein